MRVGDAGEKERAFCMDWRLTHRPALAVKRSPRRQEDGGPVLPVTCAAGGWAVKAAASVARGSGAAVVRAIPRAM